MKCALLWIKQRLALKQGRGALIKGEHLIRGGIKVERSMVGGANYGNVNSHMQLIQRSGCNA